MNNFRVVLAGTFILTVLFSLDQALAQSGSSLITSGATTSTNNIAPPSGS